MQRLDLDLFYQLGSELRALHEINRENMQRSWVYPYFDDAKDLLEAVMLGLPFRTCKAAAEQFVAAGRSIFADFYRKGGDSSKFDDSMKDSAVQRLRAVLNELQIVLRAELSQLDTYFVSQVSIFSTRDLVDNADDLFTSDIRAQLPERSRRDIRQAGKCLAFDLHDAAAFHVLKATEEVMRAYAELLSGQALEVRSRSWADYIKMLRDAGADGKIVEYLDYIRKNHRNPILHPEANLTKDESVALFNATTNAIVPMIQAMINKKAEGSSAAAT